MTAFDSSPSQLTNTHTHTRTLDTNDIACPPVCSRQWINHLLAARSSQCQSSIRFQRAQTTISPLPAINKQYYCILHNSLSFNFSSLLSVRLLSCLHFVSCSEKSVNAIRQSCVCISTVRVCVCCKSKLWICVFIAVARDDCSNFYGKNRKAAISWRQDANEPHKRDKLKANWYNLCVDLLGQRLKPAITILNGPMRAIDTRETGRKQKNPNAHAEKQQVSQSTQELTHLWSRNETRRKSNKTKA